MTSAYHCTSPHSNKRNDTTGCAPGSRAIHSDAIDDPGVPPLEIVAMVEYSNPRIYQAVHHVNVEPGGCVTQPNTRGATLLAFGDL